MSDFIMDQAEFASLVSGEGVFERVIVIDPKDKDVDIVKIDKGNHPNFIPTVEFTVKTLFKLREYPMSFSLYGFLIQ